MQTFVDVNWLIIFLIRETGWEERKKVSQKEKENGWPSIQIKKKKSY